MEIYIGREVDGLNDIKVPTEFKKVSRKHAVVTITNNGIYVKDLDTPNGTYILGNANPIAKTKLSSRDVLMLGSQNEYDSNAFRISVDEIKNHAQKIIKGDDYSKEFQKVKKVYLSYNKSIMAYKNRVLRRVFSVRFIVTIIIAAVIIVLSLFLPSDGSTNIIVRLLMMFAGLIIGASSLIWNPKNSMDDTVDIELKYLNQYKCPRCNRNFNLKTQHWKYLEASGCPYCHAKFNKNTYK